MSETASCACAECANLCRLCPGWCTPDEASLLMDAGYAKRLMRDWWTPDPTVGNDGNIYTLALASVGYEGEDAPEITWMTFLRTGNINRGQCNFLTPSGLCELHETKLKPNQCRTAYGCKACPDCPDNQQIARLWFTPEGRAVIERWATLVA